MSDKNEKKNVHWQDWASMINPVMSIFAAMTQLEYIRPKLAIDLAPGDIIRVGHVSIFIVGVRFQEILNPEDGKHDFAVLAAGAEAVYYGHDWHWRSNRVMYDSPFLQFHPAQEIEIARASPSKANSLDQLIALRNELHSKEESEPSPEKKEGNE